MELIVRAVDVGSGNTKFVMSAIGADIRCASFMSVAYPSSGDASAWPASERRKTVCIPIGPLFYEVGPDVSLAADTFRAKQLHDEYTETPEYMALLRGALSMMRLSHIDLLVVGLPVALFAVKKASLEKSRRITHRVELMSEEEVTALARRREDILAGRIAPQYSNSPKMCRRCGFRSQCDGAAFADAM